MVKNSVRITPVCPVLPKRAVSLQWMKSDLSTKPQDTVCPKGIKTGWLFHSRLLGSVAEQAWWCIFVLGINIWQKRMTICSQCVYTNTKQHNVMQFKEVQRGPFVLCHWPCGVFLVLGLKPLLCANRTNMAETTTKNLCGSKQASIYLVQYSPLKSLCFIKETSPKCICTAQTNLLCIITKS